MIRLNLTTLAHAKPGRRQVINLEVGEAEIGELKVACLRGELNFTRMTEDMLVEGTLYAEVKTTCTRCLDAFFAPLEVELADKITLPGAELTSEYPVRVENGWIDLTPLLLQYIWLELPNHPLCSPQCRGLCPQCGHNLNHGTCACGVETNEVEVVFDPRWEALRQFQEEPE